MIPAEKIQFSRQVTTGIAANPTGFPNPLPAIAGIVTATNDFENAFNAAQAARDTAKAKTVTQNEKEAHLNLLLNQIGAYAETITNGNVSLLNSIGISERITHSRVGDLPHPSNISSSASDHPGTVDLHWDKVTGVKIYMIEFTTDPAGATGWQAAGTSTKSSFTVENLTSGTKYLFRIAAVGTAGQSAWSDSVNKIAP